ncbi:isocitrate/isopropylmalate dehydrogenase family protein [Paenibacillus cymbidii]|uniref:isocitrate/isopropylmalate dehydrogenase family protein n=1 Tax=Paenibacillus cymbidii TaxID=1639034 RepID=UPI0010805CB3|nr:isocitrate/isopropylmalate dehydrogenase family protein [Paenibacillus cymbidii]
MKAYHIAVLPGDGIGIEVTETALRVLQEAGELYGAAFELESFDAGAGRYLRTGTAMPEDAFAHCKAADAILMGAIGLPEVRHPDGREVNGDVIFRLRFELDLYAGVRPIKLYEGVTSSLRNTEAGIDYVVVRENTEGLYASRTGSINIRGEVAIDTLVLTRTGTEKITDYAYRLAAKRNGRPADGRRIVTCVDKSNVLSSYAYFRHIFDEVGSRYPDIAKDYAYVDAMTLYQVMNPQYYDVVVAENMFGDILSDLAAATVGGLGLAPSGDIGAHHAMFQPSHGTAPTIAGRNIANPLATVLSVAMMLEWLADRHPHDSALAAAGRAIESAVADVLRQGDVRTRDIGGQSGTSQVGDAIVAAIRQASR